MTKKQWWVYDCEVYPNFFCCNFLNIQTQEQVSFVITPSQSQYLSLKRFYLDPNKVFVGFNNLGYDNPLLTRIFERSSKVTNKTIKLISDRLFKRKPWPKYDPRQVDLYKIMHFDNRNKMVGLKTVEGVIKWTNIRDLPYDPDKRLSPSQIEEVLEYCWNDVRATEAFFREISPKVKFHLRAKKMFGIPDHNWSESKMGEFIAGKRYTELSGKPFSGRTDHDEIIVSEIIPTYVREYKWKFPQFHKLLNELDDVVLYPTGKKILLAENEEFHKQVDLGGKVFDMKVGGLHSADEFVHIEVKEDEYLIDRDVKSLYPSLIVNLGLFPAHLGEEFLIGYREMLNQRLAAKSRIDDTSLSQSQRDDFQLISDILKLALNSVYGKSNSRYSPLYDPRLTMAVTFAGQLSLFMLIDMAVSAGIKVVSANTDGIMFHLKKKDKPLLDEICKDWEKMTALKLEDTFYKMLFQRDVNNYIAQTLEGKTKEKGAYEVDKFIGRQVAYHKNHSKRIVPLAVKEYLTKGIPLEQTILSHQNVHDFCILMRAKKAPKNGDSHFVLRDPRDADDLKEYVKTLGKKVNGKALSKAVKAQKKAIREESYQDDSIGKTIRLLAVRSGGTSRNRGLLVKRYSSGFSANFYHPTEFADYSILAKDTVVDDLEYQIDYDFYLREAEKLLHVEL